MKKSYSQFQNRDIKEQLHLTLNLVTPLFPDVQAVAISDYLAITLKKFVPLAKAINTEKARSEFIVAPILAELREMFNQEISLFSGISFNVDAQQGLQGRCDFIISLSSEQLYLTSPVITIIEAKNDNIQNGYAQCVATMIAAQLFNERAKSHIKAVYGVVTTGTNWQFLKLENKTVYVDRDEYYINAPDKLMGIFFSILDEVKKSTSA